MFRLTRFEIKKLFTQKKSLMGVATVVLINVLFTLAFHIRARKADKPHEFIKEHLIGEFLNVSVYAAYILPPTVYVLFPMVLSIIAAYILAGEMEVGSLRMMLFRPVSRWEIVMAKFLAMAMYAGLMLLVLGVGSYVLAQLVLKSEGNLLVIGRFFGLKERLIVIPGSEALPKIALLYALAWPSLMFINAMALMFAMLTRHFTSAAILTSTIYFCSYIVESVPLLSALHPYLPIRYLQYWRYALLDPVPWERIARHATWSGLYTLGFLLAAMWLFRRRDQ